MYRMSSGLCSLNCTIYADLEDYPETVQFASKFVQFEADTRVHTFLTSTSC